MALKLSLLVARLCEMALFAAWGTGRTRALLGEGFLLRWGVWGWFFRGATLCCHLATLLLSLPPARPLIRWGQVPQGGKCAQGAVDAVWWGADGLWGCALGGSGEGQDGETSSAWRGQPENCLTF